MTKKKKPTTNLREQFEIHKERRQRYLKNLVEESIVNVLAEQEMAAQQQAASAETAPPVATPENQAQAQPEQQQSVPKQYTVDNMIEELNAIRGGRSFSDPEVYGKLVTFFKNLGEEQKTVLDTLLSQIAELVTGVDDLPQDQQQGQSAGAQPPPEGGAPQQSAPMPGAQQAAGAAGVGVA